MKEEVHTLSIESILSKYTTSLKHGLTSQEVQTRLLHDGPNISVREKKSSLLDLLLRQTKSFVLYVLMAAGVLSLLIGSHVEFIVILLIVIFTLLLSFIEEYKATREMESLRKLTSRTALVFRDGKELRINAEDIVVGDILIIKRGDIIPADCRIIDSTSLKVDESLLTGESTPTEKISSMCTNNTPLSERSNMIYSGTSAIQGEAKAVCIAVGKATEFGKVSQTLHNINEDTTPLQKRLNTLGKEFSFGVLIVCAFILIIELLRGQGWEKILLLSVAVAVSGIPESLPAVIAIALAIGTKRMASKNAIIKRLPAVETLGTCTVICTDKTGTLTQNRMVIEKVYAVNTEVDITGHGFNPKGIFMSEKEEISPRKHKGIAKILEIGTLCNNANLFHDGIDWRVEGESTEGALVVLAKKAGIERLVFHSKYPRLHEHAFDSSRKIMTTIHKVKSKPIVYTKGAPEIILDKSTMYFEKGKVCKISPKIRQKILDKIEEYASQGLRILALAYKEHKGKTYAMKGVESNLIFAGLVSIRDPPHEGIIDAVKECQNAGIRVVMITGDNKLTAMAIARELGILIPNMKVMTGDEIDALSDEQFIFEAKNISVFARTTPNHKLRIVTTLQAIGEVVAMTGDGINDAPALKKADIGIAMGKGGTDVAREAAEMVLRDDNFTTIVSAVKEGRTIYTNIQKFIYYLLPGNFSEVTLILVAALFGIVPPLTPLMILFINLITSDIPAIGLCMEKPSSKIMLQKPRDPKESILNDYLMLRIGQVIPIIVFGTMAIFLWEMVIKNGNLQKAQTMAFLAIAMFELIHALNARSFMHSTFSTEFFSNPLLLIGISISFVLALSAIYFAPLANIIGTVPLSIEECAIIALMGFILLGYVELQKLVVKSEIKKRDIIDIFPTRR